MSFTYIARLRIRPETQAAFDIAIADMMVAAQADPGTLDYRVFMMADDPHNYVFFESYVDAEADAKHRADPVSGEIVRRMVACIDDSGFSQEFLTPVAAMAEQD